METGYMYNSIHIVFFSGTGGTERVARAFQGNLAERGISAPMTALEGAALKGGWGEGEAKPELMILVFAVHAFDAPEPVYAWIANTEFAGVRAAVVSVSGGGEGWPNTGCRNGVIAALEHRGAAVVYEKMMVMPCNWVVPIGDDEAMHLMNRMPGKVSTVLDAVLSGKTRRTRHHKGFLRAWVTKQEKQGCRRFPESISVGEGCTGCGLCARSCPAGNISMKDGKPAFADRCVMCFRCVYGCPARAMSSTNFMVLKGGFDIAALETRMAGAELRPVERCFRGIAWQSVRKYIQDKDGD